MELNQRRFELQGETERIQPSVEIKRILNNEGYGLETLGISQNLRRSLDPRERDWRCPTTNLVAAVPRLRDLEAWVQPQPYVPPEGGQSRIVRVLFHHPDDFLEAHLDDDAPFLDSDAAEEEERDEAHSGSSHYEEQPMPQPRPPGWIPAPSDYEALSDLFFAACSSIRRVGRTGETLRHVFESAPALVQEVLDVREAASNAARAQERAESRVAAVRDKIREGLAALAEGRNGLESLEGQVDDLVAAHAQAVVDMETERTRAETAATVATAEIASLRERVSVQSSRVAELEAEGREAAASLLALRSSAAPEIQARLTAESDAARAEATSLAAERDAARSEATSLMTSRDAALADAGRVTAELDGARADASRLTAERDAARAELAT